MDQNQIDRKQDVAWKELVEESATYPDGLDTIQERLHHSVRRRKRRMIGRGCTSFVVAFALFIVVVNTNKTIAHAISKIPILSDIAELVSFDQGLSKAAEHDCLQEVDLMDTDGEFSLHMPYVISDSRRLFLFFRIRDDIENEWLNTICSYDIELLDGETGELLEGYSLATSSMPLSLESGEEEYYHSDIRFVDRDIPRNMKVKITVYAKEHIDSEVDLGERFSDATYVEDRGFLLGQFELQLDLLEYLPPIITEIDKTIEIEGLLFRINQIIQYPTGMQLSVTFLQDEEYKVQGLQLQIKDVQGNCWGTSSGISASGPDEDGEMNYFLEGDYYNNTTFQEIEFLGIQMISKSEIDVTLDLNQRTLTPDNSAIQMVQVIKNADMADITMILEEGLCGSYFEFEYQDSKGNRYHMDSQSLATNTIDGKDEVYFSVVWPEDGIVYLKRWMYPIITLDTTIVVTLNN